MESFSLDSARKIHVSKADKLQASRMVIQPLNDYIQIKRLKQLPVKKNVYYSIQGMVVEVSGRHEIVLQDGLHAWCNGEYQNFDK